MKTKWTPVIGYVMGRNRKFLKRYLISLRQEYIINSNIDFKYKGQPGWLDQYVLLASNMDQATLDYIYPYALGVNAVAMYNEVKNLRMPFLD